MNFIRKTFSGENRRRSGSFDRGSIDREAATQGPLDHEQSLQLASELEGAGSEVAVARFLQVGRTSVHARQRCGPICHVRTPTTLAQFLCVSPILRPQACATTCPAWENNRALVGRAGAAVPLVELLRVAGAAPGARDARAAVLELLLALAEDVGDSSVRCQLVFVGAVDVLLPLLRQEAAGGALRPQALRRCANTPIMLDV